VQPADADDGVFVQAADYLRVASIDSGDAQAILDHNNEATASKAGGPACHGARLKPNSPVVRIKCCIANRARDAMLAGPFGTAEGATA
jgi:hypothetical protein